MREHPFCGVHLSSVVFAEWLCMLHLPSCGTSGELTVSVEVLLDGGAEEMGMLHVLQLQGSGKGQGGEGRRCPCHDGHGGGSTRGWGACPGLAEEQPVGR